MTKYGGIRETTQKTWEFDVPIPSIYKCEKCGQTIVEHIWVGHGYRDHVESYSTQGTHCNVQHCEINHRKKCDGSLIVVTEGQEIQAPLHIKLKSFLVGDII